MAWFNEIRDANGTLLKRDRGFADQAAAKIAAWADAKKMRRRVPLVLWFV